jgi:hypothetical protein
MKISVTGRYWIRTDPFRLPRHFPGELVHKEGCTTAVVAVLRVVKQDPKHVGQYFFKVVNECSYKCRAILLLI